MSILVAVIPAGVTIDTALAAMNAMSACYPNDSLSLSNNPTGGMMIVREPAAGPQPAAEPGPRAELALGAEDVADLFRFAFTVDDQQDALLAIAQALIGMLEQADAANFLTMTIDAPDVGRYAMTIQRCDGQTPAEKLAELETRLATHEPHQVAASGAPLDHDHDPIECGCELTADDIPRAGGR